MLFFHTLFCPKFLVSGRRGSTSSEKKRSKSRSGRDKSPFRSFRWPKSKARPEQPGSYSDDEDGSNITQRSTLRKFETVLPVHTLGRINIRTIAVFRCRMASSNGRGIS